jgi:hypothetical protein
MKLHLILIGIVVLFLLGCVKTEPVSTIPEITFKSFALQYEIDTSLDNEVLVGKLEFSFIDGDANIGLAENVYGNTKLPDSVRYNIFLFPYEKVDGHYNEIPLDTIGEIKTPPFFIIKANDKLKREGQNKTIKGVVTVSIEYFIVPDYDTMRYEFFIRDNAGNKSNVEVTSDIAFKSYRNSN